jgi:creatinine amidohydrolase/Fe(II)-dependent formamide hydrolase-like protein
MIHALKEVSKSGTLGDGRVANIETGSTILKRIVDFVGACVKDIQGMPIE